MTMTMSDAVPEKKVRILIADDEPLFRDGVKHWLALDGGMECCAEASSVAETESAVAQTHPDLVILELRLQGEDTLNLIKTLRANHPSVTMLVMSRNDETVFGDRVLRSGARGFVTKSRTGRDLVVSIRAVMAGEIQMGRRAAASIIKKLWHKGSDNADLTSKLSDRELQIFQLLGQGQSTRRIAERLKLGIKTVETHREHIKRKLDLKDAPSLVHAATRWVEGQTRSDEAG